MIYGYLDKWRYTLLEFYTLILYAGDEVLVQIARDFLLRYLEKRNSELGFLRKREAIRINFLRVSIGSISHYSYYQNSIIINH